MTQLKCIGTSRKPARPLSAPYVRRSVLTLLVLLTGCLKSKYDADEVMTALTDYDRGIFLGIAPGDSRSDLKQANNPALELHYVDGVPEYRLDLDKSGYDRYPNGLLLMVGFDDAYRVEDLHLFLGGESHNRGPLEALEGHLRTYFSPPVVEPDCFTEFDLDAGDQDHYCIWDWKDRKGNTLQVTRYTYVLTRLDDHDVSFLIEPKQPD